MDQYFKLTNQVAFYVPSTVEGSKKITKKVFSNRRDEIAKLFSKLFGGANATLLDGFYIMDNGDLVKEYNYKVVAFATTEAIKAHRVELIMIAHEKCKEWQQETIGLEINGVFYLID